MIWILLLYILPLLISVIGVYFLVKSYKGTIEDFLKPLPNLFIPIINILAIVATIFVLIQKFLHEDESWQNFKNKKL
jgi:uncharacterized membrane protein (DUF106 family)